MKTKSVLLLFAILVVCVFSSFSQTDNDTLKINFDELKFNCSQEKMAVQSTFKDADSIIKLILQAECKPQLLSASSGVQELVQKFKEKTITNKYTKEKFIKELYKAIHDKFLVTYNLNVPFSKIFEDGTFNCVTASILYAVIFEQLHINYEIHETPTHVYLVAEPQTLNITVETTAPTFGYVIHDDKFKSTFVNFLIDNKVIAKEDAEKFSVNELFNKHYYNDNSISIKALVAFLYYNSAIDFFQKEDTKQALNKFEISYYLYPYARTKFLIEAAVKDILLKNENNKKRDINYIVKLAGISNSSENNSLIKSLYSDITLDLTEKDPDIERYKSESEKIFTAIRDTNVLNDLFYVYYMSLGSHYYYTGDNMQCMENLSKAQELFPNNVRIKALLTDIISKQLYDFEEEDLENPKEAIDTLLKLYHKFPLLQKDKKFQQLITYSYAMLVEDGFANTNKATLDSYLDEFDKNVANNLYGDITKEIVGAIYTEAHKFFLRKNNYAMAKEYLKRGLKISPQNSILKEKLELIKKSGY